MNNLKIFNKVVFYLEILNLNHMKIVIVPLDIVIILLNQ